MPLLDHFHPPLAPRRHWESFYVNWAGAIADNLNESLLPEGYFAEEHAHLGPFVEIDVATFSDSVTSSSRPGGRICIMKSCGCSAMVENPCCRLRRVCTGLPIAQSSATNMSR
jgi:hypothetical protein